MSAEQDTEISVVDDFVEVTSQPLEIVTSATDSMTSSNETMLTSPDDMIMSHMMGNPLDDPDINMVSDNECSRTQKNLQNEILFSRSSNDQSSIRK